MRPTPMVTGSWQGRPSRSSICAQAVAASAGVKRDVLTATPTATTPEQLKAFTADEVKRWAEVIKQSGAKVE